MKTLSAVTLAGDKSEKEIESMHKKQADDIKVSSMNASPVHQKTVETPIASTIRKKTDETPYQTIRGNQEGPNTEVALKGKREE